ncbi:glycosyltransferase family 4 protein [Marinobacter sp.]|uniref:glycosyltransferase family 4 protein n=1 Tax=Marinobacter sp. TaxID=50741 RepID=UPI001A0DC8A5|nr:glycosyltransferase family 4 protein [Marinobacter sp.]MBE0487017.1 glycosyltransferase family 4 protein [Marinobacter sp.]
MMPKTLVVTDKSDLAETMLIIGLWDAGVPLLVTANPQGRHFDLFESAGIPVVPLVVTGRFDKDSTRVIREHLVKSKVQVVYAFNPKALACALRASKRLAVKVIAYRGVIGNVGWQHPESWITFLHPRLDRIVCVSDAVRKSLLAVRGPFGKMPERKLVRIYKGHDLAWYDRPPADLSEFRFPERSFVICCIGRDRPGKGFASLIAAMELLRAELNIHLLLVGDLEKNAKLKEQVARLPESGRVRFAGFRTDAPQVAGACDALVLPSESEGLPRVVIEAMAYGRPVVVTRAGGMPELVRNEVEGVVIPVRDPQALANALIHLASNPDRCREMGGQGQKRIRQAFNVQQTVDQTVQLLQELVD